MDNRPLQPEIVLQKPIPQPDIQFVEQTQRAIKQGLLVLKQVTMRKQNLQLLHRIIQAEIDHHLTKFTDKVFKSVGEPVKNGNGTFTLPIYFTHKTVAHEEPAGID